MQDEQIDWITKVLFAVILVTLILSYTNWFTNLYKLFLKN
jgi:hypothetical protein